MEQRELEPRSAESPVEEPSEIFLRLSQLESAWLHTGLSAQKHGLEKY